jgi:pyruvate, water dikinase
LHCSNDVFEFIPFEKKGQPMTEKYVIDFAHLRMSDVEKVGGKNASLGEMISQLTEKGVRVPGGFATTAEAYRIFLAHEGLADRIDAALATLDVDDVKALAETGKQIRDWIMATPLPAQLEAEMAEHYALLGNDVTVAVRSSATAEDLPDASFAGQQETFLNIVGYQNVVDAMKHVFASLYNDRAIAYRVHKGFDHKIVALSAGIQRMVRSDKGAAGVLFTIDTESGFDQVVFVTASYGLGETVVQGAVNPDEFFVHKPTLRAGRPAIVRRHLGGKALKMEFDTESVAGKSVRTIDVPLEDRRQFSISDEEVEELARYALIIEEHYERPMDVEWGRDGIDGNGEIARKRQRQAH